MLLADHQILAALESGDIVIDPFERSMLQPASVDIQLGNEIKLYRLRLGARNYEYEPIDPTEIVPEELVQEFQLSDNTVFSLAAKEFVLASTRQRVKLSSSIAARIEGCSTIGRLGLLIHSTAGFIDPGFDGELTLEISNVNVRPIQLQPGIKIGQLSFMQLLEPARWPYGSMEAGSHYQHQKGAMLPVPLRSNIDAMSPL